MNGQEYLREFELKTKIKVTKVVWKYPHEGLVMYNTNGASKGNSGARSYIFFLRDVQGDLLYAKGAPIEILTMHMKKKQQSYKKPYIANRHITIR